jgi:hypothetical protein
MRSLQYRSCRSNIAFGASDRSNVTEIAAMLQRLQQCCICCMQSLRQLRHRRDCMQQMRHKKMCHVALPKGRQTRRIEFDRQYSRVCLPCQPLLPLLLSHCPIKRIIMSSLALPPIVPPYVHRNIPSYPQPEINATNEMQKMCHTTLPKGRGFKNIVIVNVGAAATAGVAGVRRRQGRGT